MTDDEDTDESIRSEENITMDTGNEDILEFEEVAELLVCTCVSVCVVCVCACVVCILCVVCVCSV